jgi:hypothetical protein
VGHERDGFRPHDARPAEDAAVQEHLREAEHVVGRGKQAATPPEEARLGLEHRHEPVAADGLQRAVGAGGVDGGEAVPRLRADAEAGVAHAQRPKELLVQKTVERLPEATSITRPATSSPEP